MAAKKRPVTRKKGSLFRELMSGVEVMRDHWEGRLTLKTREVPPIATGSCPRAASRLAERNFDFLSRQAAYERASAMSSGSR